MRNYLTLKYLVFFLREYFFIFLAANIVLFITITKSFCEENVFTINNVEVEGTVDLNFSRDKYLNRAFINSFDILMNKILLTRDLQKIDDVKLKQIKSLISSFQIVEESYRKDLYKANIKIFYNEKKIKKFLGKKNISFSRPENISAIFFPILFVNNEIKNFNENFFYKSWTKVEIDNELINYILPLEDLDDISRIVKMKNKIEDLNVEALVNKYDIKNYVFVLMDYKNQKLKIYLKTNFNNNKISKNILYDLKNIEEQSALNSILLDLKLTVTDLWKEENLINLLMPLSIKVTFDHANIKDLDKMRMAFDKINIINSYTLDEFNINSSLYKIYYYGEPKKLRSELSKLGFELRNDQGNWKIYLNE
tara:strand:+ start:2088 stop:3185 length:1098 start_codon:yes stop_codon:yes gene_type:complete